MVVVTQKVSQNKLQMKTMTINVDGQAMRFK
jgi:hypothetical protein